MSLYCLLGIPNLRPGTPVEIGGPDDRYGVITSCKEEKFVLPNPCFVDGPAKSFGRTEFSLYNIKGTGWEKKQDYYSPVWGFRS